MIILNNEFILKILRKESPVKKSSKSVENLVSEKVVKKLSHLYLNDKKIGAIEDVSQFESINTLYIHNNLLTTMSNIGYFYNLTHLYLQRNKIKLIQGLEKLIKLQKLYLGYNEISVVEGLECQSNLKLLHIEHQNKSIEDALYFDPLTLNTLKDCLQDLDISGNHISSIKDLNCLGKLTDINASNNLLRNLEEVCSCVKQWDHIIQIRFNGNPICKLNQYRNQVLVSCSDTLVSLDDKTVTDITKLFVQNFEKERSNRRKSLPNIEDTFSSEVKSLVKHLPEGLCQTVSAQILQNTISGEQYHPVPITLPLNSIEEHIKRKDTKKGLRGSKRNFTTKTRKSSSQEK